MPYCFGISEFREKISSFKIFKIIVTKNKKVIGAWIPAHDPNFKKIVKTSRDKK